MIVSLIAPAIGAFDVPSNHSDGKVPILDVKVAITKDNLVEYIFYKKPMANKVQNRANKALPEKQKVTSATQEVIRRMKNCSTWILPNLVKDVLLDYMGELKAGGYSTSWRRDILQSGLLGFGRMWSLQETDCKRINRPEATTALKRRAPNLVGQQTWFKGKLAKAPKRRVGAKKNKKHTKAHLIPEGVLFLPNTPGGEHRRRVQDLP